MINFKTMITDFTMFKFVKLYFISEQSWNWWTHAQSIVKFVYIISKFAPFCYVRPTVFIPNCTVHAVLYCTVPYTGWKARIYLYEIYNGDTIRPAALKYCNIDLLWATIFCSEWVLGLSDPEIFKNHLMLKSQKI